MIEIITGIITSIIEAIMKNKFERKHTSAPKALYFMFLSINVIIDEAEKVLSQIDAKLIGKQQTQHKDFNESLLEIFRQTQIFLDNASHVVGSEGLMRIFDQGTNKLMKLAYQYDMSLFWALDQMVATIRRTFRDEKKVFDFNPTTNPEAIYQLGNLGRFKEDGELAKIRKSNNIQLIEINDPKELDKFYKFSHKRIKKLKDCSKQLAAFIKEYCDLNDFVELKKNDLSIWRRSWRFLDKEEEWEIENARKERRKHEGTESFLRKRVKEFEARIEQIEGKPFVDSLGHQFSPKGICPKCGCTKQFVEYFGTKCNE